MHGNKIERIIDTIEDEYIKDIVRKNGYGKLKFNMQRDIEVLVKEGFVLNDYALNIIKEFYGVRMNTAGDIDHCGVQMSIDPITASGEFDESFKETEELLGSTIFPLGEFFQNDLYVSSDGKIYSLGGARITLRGDSFTDFLNKIFRKDLIGNSVILYDFDEENTCKKILSDIQKRWSWIDVSDTKDLNDLLNNRVMPQVADKLNSTTGETSDLDTFFSYVESFLTSNRSTEYYAMKKALVSFLFNFHITLDKLDPYLREKSYEVVHTVHKEMDKMFVYTEKDTVRFPLVCPVCNKHSVHVYFHRYDERGHGGMWSWCNNCSAYSHGSGIVPEWWENSNLIDSDELTHSPDFAKGHEHTLDQWINRLKAKRDDVKVFPIFDCEKCGSNMNETEEGMECPKCGFKISGYHHESINDDESTYVITLLEGNVIDQTTIEVINKVSHLKLKAAKEALENAPVRIFSGDASNTKYMKIILDSAGIKYRVENDDLLEEKGK